MLQLPPSGDAVNVAVAPGQTLVESMDGEPDGLTVTVALIHVVVGLVWFYPF